MNNQRFTNTRKSLYALPIVTIVFAALSFMTSCDKENLVYAKDMKAFYDESFGLKQVSSDSIKRFATKVETYVIKNPAEKRNPLYPEIKENIKTATKAGGISFVITINYEWEGDTTIYF